MLNYTYDFKNCCPDLSADCNKKAPNISIIVNGPLTLNGDSGSVLITLTGLYKLYTFKFNNEFGTINSQQLFLNLSPGDYVLELFDINDPTCYWVYSITVPNYIPFDVELYYQDYLTQPVPKIPFDPNPALPTPSKLYWNNDRILKRGSGVQQQCFELVITGGTAPYTITWKDYVGYNNVVPAGLTTPGFPIPPQVGFISFFEQSPRLSSANGTGIVSDVLKTCVTVVPNNGNGWININVLDSQSLEVNMWLYIKQSPLF